MAKEAHVPNAGAITDELGQAVELLKTRADSYHRGKAFEGNQAKQMADSFKGKIPIIYGWDGLGEVAAYRWKCQLTECAKVPAWHNAFPELNHNEIVGWDQLQSLTGSSLVLIILRNLSTSGLGEHDRISKRIEITKPMISDHFSLVREVWSAGSGIGALYDLAYVGDFVATYLAIAQGVDPSPVEAIGHLKRELSKD
jgi:glucose/mannose-6-phosphate isomerase